MPEPKTPPVLEGIFFDTETTGMVKWKTPSHMPDQPHMTQLAAIHVDLIHRKIIQSMNVYIIPEGWTINDECIELNGITTEYADAVGVPEKLALDMFISMWDGKKRFAFNTTFDNRIIRIAAKRHLRSEVDRWKEGDYECQMLRARKFLTLKKNPKLVDAYKELTGSELIDAHDAMADVMATWAIYNIMEDAEVVDADIFS